MNRRLFLGSIIGGAGTAILGPWLGRFNGLRPLYRKLRTIREEGFTRKGQPFTYAQFEPILTETINRELQIQFELHDSLYAKFTTYQGPYGDTE